MNEKNLSDNPNLKQIDEKKLILIESLVAQFRIFQYIGRTACIYLHIFL